MLTQQVDILHTLPKADWQEPPLFAIGVNGANGTHDEARSVAASGRLASASGAQTCTPLSGRMQEARIQEAAACAHPAG